jgi:membrane fusion protein (multidrug efflux system)
MTRTMHRTRYHVATMRSAILTFLRPLIAVTAMAALAACGAKGTPPPPPPAEVSVVTVTPAPAEENLEFVGQVEAFRSVQVRAKVSGIITARPFQEGAQVHAGDVLYRIDPTTYAADFRSARASLAEAQAQLSNAATSAARLRPLLAAHAVASQDVDNAESTLQQRRAAVDVARAGVDRARKDLDETVIRAEISGRAGRALLDLGARVSGPSDMLTTIDVIDPVYVSFRPSAEQQFRWKRDPTLRRTIEPGGGARVQAVLPDGSAFPVTGRIGFIDPVVDPQTGTQQFRAEFASHERLLLPGQFVRVRLLGLTRREAIVIPQRAVLQQMGRQTVYVVGPANKIVARDVKAAGWTGASWLIEQGLAAGDRVVVDGVQKIGPGAVVKPTELAAGSASEPRLATAPAQAQP